MDGRSVPVGDGDCVNDHHQHRHRRLPHENDRHHQHHAQDHVGADVRRRPKIKRGTRNEKTRRRRVAKRCEPLITIPVAMILLLLLPPAWSFSSPAMPYTAIGFPFFASRQMFRQTRISVGTATSKHAELTRRRSHGILRVDAHGHDVPSESPDIVTSSSHLLNREIQNGSFRRTDDDEKNKKTKPNRSIPRHVAIVCDGNSRWARQRHLPTRLGHYEGAQRLVNDVIPAILGQEGVEILTLYAFSCENWNRPDDEVAALFEIMTQMAKQFRPRAIQERLTVRVLGDMQDARLPNEMRRALRKLEIDTAEAAQASSASASASIPTTASMLPAQPPSKTLCLAINYGGRQDIAQAMRQIARQVQDGSIANIDDITETMISDRLWTSQLPNPDLLIRTSGESRISNFLLWDVAYSEIYITPTNFPDFGKDEWGDALTWFQSRKRRFGGR